MLSHRLLSTKTLGDPILRGLVISRCAGMVLPIILTRAHRAQGKERTHGIDTGIQM